jgi:hypothetical protein
VSLPKPNAAFGGRKVFLSHASTDRAFVLRLVKILKQNQVSFWYSETDIQGAKQWHDEIGRALTKCNWFLLVLTPNSIHSPWVKRELLFALEQKRYNEKIIPLLYKRCRFAKLSWTLSGFQVVDFTADFDNGCRQLLRIWGIDYDHKSAATQATNKKKKKAY